MLGSIALSAVLIFEVVQISIPAHFHYHDTQTLFLKMYSSLTVTVWLLEQFL